MVHDFIPLNENELIISYNMEKFLYRYIVFFIVYGAVDMYSMPEPIAQLNAIIYLLKHLHSIQLLENVPMWYWYTFKQVTMTQVNWTEPLSKLFVWCFDVLMNCDENESWSNSMSIFLDIHQNIDIKHEISPRSILFWNQFNNLFTQKVCGMWFRTITSYDLI